MKKQLILLCGIWLLTSFAAANSVDHNIEGRWLTADGQGWIDFRLQNGIPAGFIAGSPLDPDRRQPQRLDVHNPDPELRDRPLHGLQIIRDLSQNARNRWKGLIYDPNSGKTFHCTLTMADGNTLELRGYVGVALFGRTEIWTRVR